jgi:hypothetical protein
LSNSGHLNASTTSSERMWSAIDHPTTVRLDMSGTAAQETFAQCGGEALIECAGAVKAR